MSIAGDLIRGHTDAIILARLMLRDSYGYEINKTVTQLSGGKLELKRSHLIHRLPPVGGKWARGFLLGRRGQRGPPQILHHYAGGTADLYPPLGRMGRDQRNYG